MKIPNPQTSEEWEAAFAAGPVAKWSDSKDEPEAQIRKARWKMSASSHGPRWALWKIVGKKKEKSESAECVFGAMTGDDFIPKSERRRMLVRAEVYIAHRWSGK